jgi:uncharacterized protein involved in exopolysaccharide biosynthesis
MNERMERSGQDPEEAGRSLDVTGVVRLLLDHRSWIISCVLLATIGGVLYALFATPVYSSYATLGLKDRDQGEGTSRFLSQFSAIGPGGMANNTLNKMEVILNSHDLAEIVLQNNPNLMPELFPKMWDFERKAWKPKYAKRIPDREDGIRVLQGLLEVENNTRKGFITLDARARTARLSKRIADAYLTALRDKIRVDVMKAADADRKYLEAQLNNTLDPILREKIQVMIAFQIEKAMLVSSQAFEVLEQPIVPRKRIGPQRKKIVISAFLAGFVFSVMAVYGKLALKNLRIALREDGTSSRLQKRS